MKKRHFSNGWRAISLVFLLAVISAAQTTGTPAPDPALSPQEVVANLYGIVSAAGGQTPDWEKVRACFVKEAVIVLRTSRTTTTIFSLDSFIKDFVDFYERAYRRGGVTLYPKKEGFTEKVLKLKAWEFWDMAHVLVLYEAHINNSPAPPEQGIDSWLLSRRDGRWMIVACVNDLVTKDHPVPPELRDDK
jgi:hypothetical protein